MCSGRRSLLPKISHHPHHHHPYPFYPSYISQSSPPVTVSLHISNQIFFASPLLIVVLLGLRLKTRL